MISENPQVSIDEMRIALDVTDRTVARDIYELKRYKIIERVEADKSAMLSTISSVLPATSREIHFIAPIISDEIHPIPTRAESR